MVKTPLPLALIVLWAPSFAIYGEYGKTSHMRLTQNSIVGAYHHLEPDGVGNKA